MAATYNDDPGSLFEQWLKSRELPPHRTTCEYCDNGKLCPCGKHVWCTWNEDFYSTGDVFFSTECNGYRLKEFPNELNDDRME